MTDGWFKGKKSIASVNTKLPREELLRISRILVVDDEEPELIKDLRNVHFAVDDLPDITSANMNCIDRPIYDLILLDFGNVGKTFGADEEGIVASAYQASDLARLSSYRTRPKR